jgi:hypothetical protein
MIPAEIVELTDTELDAVSGGFLNLGNVITQVNVAVPIASAFGGGGPRRAGGVGVSDPAVRTPAVGVARQRIPVVLGLLPTREGGKARALQRVGDQGNRQVHARLSAGKSAACMLVSKLGVINGAFRLISRRFRLISKRRSCLLVRLLGCAFSTIMKGAGKHPACCRLPGCDTTRSPRLRCRKASGGRDVDQGSVNHKTKLINGAFGQYPGAFG